MYKASCIHIHSPPLTFVYNTTFRTFVIGNYHCCYTIVCIAAMIVLFIIIKIFILKFISLLVLYPFYKAFEKAIDYVKGIINDRIYNARLDIYKSQTRIEAEQKLSFGARYFDAVKQCLNARFPDNKEKNNEGNNNLIDV